MEIIEICGQYVAEAFSFLGHHLFVMNLLLSFVIVFFQRKEPKSAWAWLLVLNVLPGIGFLMYLLAGTDMHKRDRKSVV